MAPKAYDAVLLASFGGPEGQDDVIPFLRNVTRGRGIPDERLEEVSHHYRANGGISPINAAEPRAEGRPRGRAGRPRDRAAGALGQPQLGALHPADPAGDPRRRPPPGARWSPPAPTPATPAAASTARTSAWRCPRPGSTASSRWTRSASTSTTPASWNRSWKAPPPAWPTSAPSWPPPAPRGPDPDRVHHALDPDLRRRGRRSAPSCAAGSRPRLRRPSTWPSRAPSGRVGGRGSGVVAGVPVPLRRPPRAVAGAGHQRRTHRVRRGRNPRRRRGADRLRLRPHGGGLGPGHRGQADLRRPGAGLPPRPHRRHAPQVRARHRGPGLRTPGRPRRLRAAGGPRHRGRAGPLVRRLPGQLLRQGDAGRDRAAHHRRRRLGMGVPQA